MDFGEKRNRKRWKQTEGKEDFAGNRSRLIMLNAAVILIVVVIAMAVQLVRLNRTGTTNDIKAESVVKTEQTPLPTEEPTQEPQEETEEREDVRKNLNPDKPMVALTFDDGPYDKVTNRIVKTLAKYEARATFFVVGNRVAKYSDTLKNAYNDGNEIGTHTYDHGDLSKMKKAGILWEMKKSGRAIQDVLGVKPDLLRPPYGNVNDKMRRLVGLPMIYWSIDSEDWKSRNVKKILKRCKEIQDGDIVLMHDLYPTTADAIEKLVPKLIKKGFQLVTVEELFYYRGIEAQAGKVYYSGK